MHRSVFIMIVTHSAYLLSLMLVGVLEVGTSVGRRCSTIVWDRFVGRVCVFGVWRRGTNLSRTVVSSCLARGYSRLLVVVGCVVVPVEPLLVVVFPCVCGFGCQGFPCFP